MLSGTVDRMLASFCTSGLPAVRMQAKSDLNYPVLPYTMYSVCKKTAYTARVETCISLCTCT